MPKPTLSQPVLEKLALRFKALSEPNRLAILAVLLTRECSVTELIEATGLGQANVSKHLHLLHQQGFVERRKEGLNVVYRLVDEDVFVICELMCGRLEREALGLGDLMASRRSKPARRKRA